MSVRLLIFDFVYRKKVKGKTFYSLLAVSHDASAIKAGRIVFTAPTLLASYQKTMP